MYNFLEKYRFLVSLLMGCILSVLVLVIWYGNHTKIKENQRNKIRETSQLITLQFQEEVQQNINTLRNLKNRLEITKGEYFNYWDKDAGMIVEQDSSFLFVEWIDSSMVIQMIEPMQGNEDAIGLDISNLDYRKEDWEQARQDSIINFTYWLELVQGYNAFLVDAPVFYEENFQGTITAGINFNEQFNSIMQGLNLYNVEISDSRGTVFYTFGGAPKASFAEDENFTIKHNISLENTNSGSWQVRVFPNQLFEQENSMAGTYFALGLGLILSVFVSVIFYFMQTAFIAQKSARRANEKMRALIESSPMAIYAIDTKGTVRDFWNKAAEEMLGWTQEEALGQFMPHVARGWEEDFESLMQKSLQNGSIKNKEIIRYRKDGTPIHLRLNVGRIIGQDAEEQQMLAILEDFTQVKEYQKQLEDSVQEREVLLSEVHHRVKNNLAIIIGLIELQKEGLSDKELQLILNETQNRIYSISGVHELLYNTNSFSDITFEEYAEKLIKRIRGMYDSEEKHITIDHDLASRNLNINQAIPLGLLLNELISNSFKHAFKDQKEGKIFIGLTEDKGTIEVIYKDNGSGFDKTMFDQSTTLGVTLIKTLIAQLEADYSLETDQGFSFTFRFQVKEKGAHSNI